MSLYVSNKYPGAYMINFLLIIFCDILILLMLSKRRCRKSTSKKKIQIRGWYGTLGSEISSYEEISEETDFHQ